MDATGAMVVHDDRCHCAVFGDESRDYIGMLPLGFFGGDRDVYWSVMFHEIIHWVVLGRRRLCWDGEYSQGELIAEIGAAILANHCDIPKTGEMDVQGEHVQAWIKGSREDPVYFTDACSVAERAVEFVVL